EALAQMVAVPLAEQRLRVLADGDLDVARVLTDEDVDALDASLSHAFPRPFVEHFPALLGVGKRTLDVAPLLALLRYFLDGEDGDLFAGLLVDALDAGVRFLDGLGLEQSGRVLDLGADDSRAEE